MKKSILIGTLLLALAILSTGCSQNSATLTLKGDIQNNIISSISTVSGKIVDMNKNLGETVKKGDLIAVIDDKNQTFVVEQLQAAVDFKTARLEEIEVGSRPLQIKQLEAQARVAKSQWDLISAGSRTEQKKQASLNVSIAKEGVNSAQISFDYASSQYENALTGYGLGTITKAELDAAKYKKDLAFRQLATAKFQRDSAISQLALVEKGSTPQSISAAKANYEAIKAQLELAKVGATSQAIVIAEADLNIAKAQLEQGKNLLESYKITSLADGVIISKNYQLGDVVVASSNIVDIAIDNDLYVIAYIPDKYLGKIQYGQKLKVNTPVGAIEGNVIYIDLNNEYTPKDKQSTNDSQHKATKIKVKITSTKGNLKSGMTADIEVPLK